MEILKTNNFSLYDTGEIQIKCSKCGNFTDYDKSSKQAKWLQGLYANDRGAELKQVSENWLCNDCNTTYKDEGLEKSPEAIQWLEKKDWQDKKREEILRGQAINLAWQATVVEHGDEGLTDGQFEEVFETHFNRALNIIKKLNK